jgi:hypothetical protein
VDALHSFDADLVRLDGKIAGLKICRPDKDPDFPAKQKTTELGLSIPPRKPFPPPPPEEAN